MSDNLVKAEEIEFFLNTIFTAIAASNKTLPHFFTIQNSSTYLSLVLARMNMDEHHDFSFGNEPQEYKPTLQYELDSILLNFCKLLTSFNRIWEFKEVHPLFRLLPLKFLEPLTLITKHSRFGSFYCRIELADRS